VQVMHGLPPVVARVDHCPVATVRDALASGDLGGEKQRLPQEVTVRVTDGIEGRHVLPRDDQDMQWRLGTNVPKRDEAFALVDEIGRNRAAGNLAEQTIGIAHIARLTRTRPDTNTSSLSDMETRRTGDHVPGSVRCCRC